MSFSATPARRSASTWWSGFWSAVETRAYPSRFSSLCMPLVGRATIVEKRYARHKSDTPATDVEKQPPAQHPRPVDNRGGRPAAAAVDWSVARHGRGRFWSPALPLRRAKAEVELAGPRVAALVPDRQCRAARSGLWRVLLVARCDSG